jgi:hypothetical protein
MIIDMHFVNVTQELDRFYRKWGLFCPDDFAQGHFAQHFAPRNEKEEANLACTSLLTNKISEDLGDLSGQNHWAKSLG